MEKILIIDDDKINRQILARAVEKMGLIVIQSANGKHGWETLSENEDISCVITDMVMPDMDGRELVYLIRYNEKFKDIPVLIISGVFSSEELDPILQISPRNTFFLAKPIDIAALKKSVSELTQSRKSKDN